MSPWTRVLIPLDGSEISSWVLKRARLLLERPGITVTLLRVVETDEDRASELGFRVDSRHLDVQAALSAVREELLQRSIAAHAELRFGDPAREILREIASGGYDVVAMSTHGRTGLRRVMFGSVAFKVLQASPVPLLLFRPLQAPDGSLSTVETSDPARFRNILVPLDGSPAAEEILAAARGLARAYGSKLHLFRAIPGGSDEAEYRRQAVEYLVHWERLLGQWGIVAFGAVRTGPAAEQALEVIRERGLDAVAMTTHGHTSLARVVYGSVAEKVLVGAEVPMLVLRNSRLRSRLPEPAPPHRHVEV